MQRESMIRILVIVLALTIATAAKYSAAAHTIASVTDNPTQPGFTLPPGFLGCLHEQEQAKYNEDLIELNLRKNQAIK